MYDLVAIPVLQEAGLDYQTLRFHDGMNFRKQKPQMGVSEGKTCAKT